MRRFLTLILLLGALAPAFSATRLYLSYSNTAPASPAVDTNWQQTTSFDRRKCTLNKPDGSYSSSSYKWIPNNSFTGRVLNRQFISDQLVDAVTISGTVRGQVPGWNAYTNHRCVSAVGVRVVSGDGSTVRGTLLPITYPASNATNWYTSGTGWNNRHAPIETAVTPVAAQAGDRIVIEVGYYRYSVGTAYYDWQLLTGTTSMTDAPVDQTTNGTRNAWIEFSQDLNLGQVRRRVIMID